MNCRVKDSAKKPDVNQTPFRVQTLIAPKGASSVRRPPKGHMAPADCHLATNFRTVRPTSNIDKAFIFPLRPLTLPPLLNLGDCANLVCEPKKIHPCRDLYEGAKEGVYRAKFRYESVRGKGKTKRGTY